MILDNEAWYSTTPRAIAEHQAKACFAQVGRENIVKERVVLDAFCGVGGNSIAFAKAGYKVIGCDIDSEKVTMVSQVFLHTSLRRLEFISDHSVGKRKCSVCWSPRNRFCLLQLH